MSLEAEKARYKVLLTDRNRVSNCRMRIRIALHQHFQTHGYTSQQIEDFLDQAEACNFEPLLQALQGTDRGTPP